MVSDLFSEYKLIAHFKSDDVISKLIEDDPVRPHIPMQDRFARNRTVFTLEKNERVVAVCCVALLDYIPVDEEELFYEDNINQDVAILYTIWSYEKGSGSILVHKLLKHLKYLYVRRVLTLSPKTDMAYNFHVNKNGGWIYRTNENTVNYEYDL